MHNNTLHHYLIDAGRRARQTAEPPVFSLRLRAQELGNRLFSAGRQGPPFIIDWRPVA